MSKKNGGVGLQDLFPRFTYTEATTDVLWSYGHTTVLWSYIPRHTRNKFSHSCKICKYR